jgi:predicted nucleic acid-binding protein
MIAVTDTSPLNYLILIEFQDVLPKLFERVLIPQAVHRELRSAVAPDPVKRFIADVPAWLEIRLAPEIDSGLRPLDSGEREVIALAIAIRADSVLLDERKGRQAARERGLRVSGTLGVIRLAADRGLLKSVEAVERLERTNFRATPKMFNSLRGNAGQGSR